MNTPPPVPPRPLPPLPDDRIDAIETRLFDLIEQDRAGDARRRARRGRVWLGLTGAAAVVVVAAMIGPTLVGGFATSGRDESSTDLTAVAPAVGVPDGVSGMIEPYAAGEESVPGLDIDALSPGLGQTDAEIVSHGSISLRVGDVDAGVSDVTRIARAAEGYVQTSEIGRSSETIYEGYPQVASSSGAWMQIRVPAEALDDVFDDVAALGDVVTSSLSREDVTSIAIDLRARVTAAETSVDRLTTLLSQAETTADLIAAESALAERQATLEAYQQELATLDSRIAMSTLSVSLTPEDEPTTADPAGFWDGITAGWTAVVATLNGVVIGIGFLLPWLGVLGVAGVVVWLVVRGVRSHRGKRAQQPKE